MKEENYVDHILACANNCLYCSTAKLCNPGRCLLGYNFNATTQLCDLQRKKLVVY